MTCELKRYKLRPYDHEAFFAVWRPIVGLRRRHGFDVLFALFDASSGWFTWAIAHDDFDAAAARYYADPDRAALDIVVDYVAEHEITRVEAIPLP